MSARLFVCLYTPQAVPRKGALAAVAREFSSRIEVRGDRLVLCDVSGLERLFGDAQAIGLELGRAAIRRGLAPRMAVAATRVTAWLMACARPGLTVVPPGAEALAVAPLPIEALAALAKAEAPSGGTRPRRRARRRGATSRHYRLAPAPAEVDVETGVAAGFSQAEKSPASGLPTSLLQSSVEARRSLGGGGWPPASDLPSLLSTLSRWGVKTLGELAALPAAALSARLGPAGPVLCRLARGEDLQPLAPDPEPARFEASFDLEWPVEALEPLSFVLARLLEPLCADLERADRGAVGLALRLRLVTRETWTRALHLPTPIRDSRVLRTLLLLDLESHPPPAGIDRVTVEAEPSPGRIVQYSLIEHPLPSPEQLSTLMARLDALMGGGRSGAPALVDSHEPGAFAMRALGAGRWAMGKALRPDSRSARLQTCAAEAGGRRPEVGGQGFPWPPISDPRPLVPGVLRRFRVPIVAAVVAGAGRPVRVTTGRRSLPGGRVVQCAGPWRTSGQWWDASAWDRDEWDVLLADGAVYRLSRDRATRRWAIEGVVD